MSKRFLARTFICGLMGVMGMSIACNKSPSGPTSPSSAISSAVTTMTVASIFPPAGLSGDPVRVTGEGFVLGATLKFDGVSASVTGLNSTLILATIPTHGAGKADVVVTNPGGQSGTLTGGYTFEAMTLTASSSHVIAGEQLSVSWMAPGGRAALDWIALLKVGDSSRSYASGWWDYTNGAASGTFILSAPVQPGDYEFRYLPDDGYIDAARSTPVIVIAPASP